jgi:hypothetical protein
LRREITEDPPRENAVAEFIYGNLQVAGDPNKITPPLEIEVEQATPAMEAQVEHDLSLVDAGWRHKVSVKISPARTRVSQIEVALPAGFQYDETVGPSPLDVVDRLDIDTNTAGIRIARVKLVKDMAQPFTLGFHGTYELPGARQKAVLELPRPTHALDRGGRVSVRLPEGMELLVPGSGPDAACMPQPIVGMNTWRTDRFPTHVELAWRPARPDLTARAEIDVTLTSRQANVRQRLHLQFASTAPTRIALVVPASVVDRLRLLQGGELNPNGSVQLVGPVGQEHKLEMTYSLPLPDSNAQQATGTLPQLSIPFIALSSATQTETKVRVWSPSGLVPALGATAAWEEQRVQAVSDRDSLPCLVARSTNLGAPLVLGLREGATSSSPMIVDRALIRASASIDGSKQYRAQFLIRRFSGEAVAMDMPAPLENLELFLDGKKVTRFHTRRNAENGPETVTLQVPVDTIVKPVVLEVRYQIPSGTRTTRWSTTFRPPLFREKVLVGRVRWQIELPVSWVAMVDGPAAGPEQRWAWRGGLLTPRPRASAAELQAWVTEGAGVDSSPTANHYNAEPSLVCSEATLGPLRIVHFPRAAWLLGGSLVLLLIAFALGSQRLSLQVRWVCAVVLLLACLLLAVLRPGWLSLVVYACEPGIVALVLILGMKRIRSLRYHNKVTHLPGFARMNIGSRRERNRALGGLTSDSPMRVDSAVKQTVDGGSA